MHLRAAVKPIRATLGEASNSCKDEFIRYNRLQHRSPFGVDYAPRLASPRLASPRLASPEIAALFFLAAIPSVLASPIQVYIVAGQSNANGGGNIVDLAPNEAELAEPQESLFQYRLLGQTLVETEMWQPLAPRRNSPQSPNAYFGADLSFGQAMERRTGTPIAIIKVAANGTSLAEEWLPSKEDRYPWMVEKVDSALEQLGSLGFTPTLSGFLWNQGEGDAGVLSRAEAYDDNLAALAMAVRTDFDAPNLPFLFNEAHINLARAFVPQLRQSQLNAASADPLMRLINADDLLLGYDAVHFTTEMHVELGRRFADALMPSADFNNDGLVDAMDLAAWEVSFGSTRVGDTNADGVADGADFLLWQRQLLIAPELIGALRTVPEPTTLPMAAACAFCLSYVRKVSERRRLAH